MTNLKRVFGRSGAGSKWDFAKAMIFTLAFTVGVDNLLGVKLDILIVTVVIGVSCVGIGWLVAKGI